MKKIGVNNTPATLLLDRVLSMPNLVATIQALPAERLGALIHEVGIEDAGEIIALATNTQLEAMFDDDLWKSTEEAEEKFDAQRFALWLEVLFEAGEGAVVRRLVELPREFVCFAVANIAYVIDMDVLADDVEMDERYLDRVERALDSAASEEWEEFRLIDRGVGGFDVLVTALLALDTEHSTLLRDVLERCCDLTSTEVEESGGLLESLSRLQAAGEAVRGARQERRTQRGYVPLADARAFLRIVSGGVTYDTGRDPVTHAYFRDVYGKAWAQSDLRTSSAPRRDHRLVELLGSDMATHHNVSPNATLGEALGLLREENPETHSRRVAELAYLANVLVTASEPLERRMRPIEASAAALQVCALGVHTLGFGNLEVRQLAAQLADVLLDVAFRAGWARAVDEARAGDPSLQLVEQVVRRATAPGDA